MSPKQVLPVEGVAHSGRWLLETLVKVFKNSKAAEDPRVAERRHCLCSALLLSLRTDGLW